MVAMKPNFSKMSRTFCEKPLIVDHGFQVVAHIVRRFSSNRNSALSEAAA
jgi:hypothetical protein